ncbi:PREDICTED: probable E3 ubiquitin-protein ligase RNF217 [Nicotiana attenuata]|uniref:RBR-type E3 ubiquitin transferase n=1 Tax=Nicotiana attenuata TaxID=49451 RepID=A0A1J6KMD2_NICAT|nr:PREDICTED: probable E3 ubiquitin-protein ligase RNF217 [Nicotiana attenuata]OIT20369.1 putative e3 ubiquitin-protein ligase ari3 [Nicotiana attenuata]
MGNTLQKLGQNHSEQNQEHELQVTELPGEPQNFTCEICIEPMLLPNKKFKNQNLCVHPFCTDCIIKYITVKLDDNIGDIPCPSLNCKNFLDPISCRNLVGPELFVKWCDVFYESAVLGLAHCYCPNQNCSVLILDECGGNAKRSKCPNCKSLFCFQCKLPWHAGLRCGELRDENDVAFRVLAKRKKWKRCPKCRHFVELVDGCKSVRCRCGAKFCYKCGGRVYGRDWCALLIWDYCCPCSRSSKN